MCFCGILRAKTKGDDDDDGDDDDGGGSDDDNNGRQKWQLFVRIAIFPFQKCWVVLWFSKCSNPFGQGFSWKGLKPPVISWCFSTRRLLAENASPWTTAGDANTAECSWGIASSRRGCGRFVLTFGWMNRGRQGRGKTKRDWYPGLVFLLFF